MERKVLDSCGKKRKGQDHTDECRGGLAPPRGKQVPAA